MYQSIWIQLARTRPRPRPTSSPSGQIRSRPSLPLPVPFARKPRPTRRFAEIIESRTAARSQLGQEQGQRRRFKRRLHPRRQDARALCGRGRDQRVKPEYPRLTRSPGQAAARATAERRRR